MNSLTNEEITKRIQYVTECINSELATHFPLRSEQQSSEMRISSMRAKIAEYQSMLK
jgi:hypothetical protein